MSGPSRRRLLRSVGGLAAGVGAIGTVTARDDDQEHPLEVGGTSCEWDRTDDSHLPFETDGYGGWGGHAFHGTEPGLDQYPVVFVHGNTRDACDFLEHADYFLERGVGGDALWSITFGRETSTHEEMRAQLDDFVTKILAYTGVNRVSLVGHSLGVTGIRYWLDGLEAHPDRYDRTNAVVGLAGANHGTWTCGPGCEAGPSIWRVCDWISHDCADTAGEPLYELNHPDETPRDDEVAYYTIRGTRDEFFLVRPDSPALAGAENVVLETDHDGVRTSGATKRLLYQWLSEPLPPDASRQDWRR